MNKQSIVPNWCLYFSFFLYSSFFTLVILCHILNFEIPKVIRLIYFILIIFNFLYALHLGSGKKYKLSEEDTKFLKEKGVN